MFRLFLLGETADTGVRRLKDPKRDVCQRSSSDVFIFTTANDLGDLEYIRIWHDNTGGGWYLKYGRHVIISMLCASMKLTFVNKTLR